MSPLTEVFEMLVAHHDSRVHPPIDTSNQICNRQTSAWLMAMADLEHDDPEQAPTCQGRTEYTATRTEYDERMYWLRQAS